MDSVLVDAMLFGSLWALGFVVGIWFSLFDAGSEF